MIPRPPVAVCDLMSERLLQRYPPLIQIGLRRDIHVTLGLAAVVVRPPVKATAGNPIRARSGIAIIGHLILDGGPEHDKLARERLIKESGD